MRQRLAALLLLLSVVTTAKTKERGGIFTSPCEYDGQLGKSRWSAKTDSTRPPPSRSEIKHVTVAEMCAWEGLGRRPEGAARIGREREWYSLECKIAAVKVEPDGDLHIEVIGTDPSPGRVVIEVPFAPQWCEMRKLAFSWTNAEFPVKRGQFKTIAHPTVTVIGRAFFDVDHVGKGGNLLNNARDHDKNVAVWEIHPVMEMRVASKTVAVSGSDANAQPASTTPTHPTESQAVSPTPTPQQHFVTITTPVPIKIPYGASVLPRGMKLPVVSRTETAVRVRYMEANYDVPLSSVTNSD